MLSWKYTIGSTQYVVCFCAQYEIYSMKYALEMEGPMGQYCRRVSTYDLCGPGKRPVLDPKSRSIIPSICSGGKRGRQRGGPA